MLHSGMWGTWKTITLNQSTFLICLVIIYRDVDPWEGEDVVACVVEEGVRENLQI